MLERPKRYSSSMLGAGEVTGMVKDRAAAKDLGAFVRQLEALDTSPQEASSFPLHLPLSLFPSPFFPLHLHSLFPSPPLCSSLFLSALRVESCRWVNSDGSRTLCLQPKSGHVTLARQTLLSPLSCTDWPCTAHTMRWIMRPCFLKGCSLQSKASSPCLNIRNGE